MSIAKTTIADLRRRCACADCRIDRPAGGFPPDGQRPPACRCTRATTAAANSPNPCGSDDQSDSSETHGYGAQGEETEDASDQEDASETVADQAQTEMQMGSGDEEEPGRAERPWLPPGALSNEPLGQQYHAYTVKFDEIVDADQLCDAEELGRLRNHLDQQLSHLQGVIGKLAGSK